MMCISEVMKKKEGRWWSQAQKKGTTQLWFYVKAWHLALSYISLFLHSWSQGPSPACLQLCCQAPCPTYIVFLPHLYLNQRAAPQHCCLWRVTGSSWGKSHRIAHFMKKANRWLICYVKEAQGNGACSERWQLWRVWDFCFFLEQEKLHTWEKGIKSGIKCSLNHGKMHSFLTKQQ